MHTGACTQVSLVRAHVVVVAGVQPAGLALVAPGRLLPGRLLPPAGPAACEQGQGAGGRGELEECCGRAPEGGEAGGHASPHRGVEGQASTSAVPTHRGSGRGRRGRGGARAWRSRRAAWHGAGGRCMERGSGAGAGRPGVEAHSWHRSEAGGAARSLRGWCVACTAGAAPLTMRSSVLCQRASCFLCFFSQGCRQGGAVRQAGRGALAAGRHGQRNACACALRTTLPKTRKPASYDPQGLVLLAALAAGHPGVELAHWGGGGGG